jgi:hypothetical protein
MIKVVGCYEKAAQVLAKGTSRNKRWSRVLSSSSTSVPSPSSPPLPSVVFYGRVPDDDNKHRDLRLRPALLACQGDGEESLLSRASVLEACKQLQRDLSPEARILSQPTLEWMAKLEEGGCVA